MIFDFMRVILFFDLPVITAKDRRIYSKFRKYLIANGYMMLQFSVYSKIFNNRDAAVKHITTIKKHVPEKGSIRLMLVTEKQYAKMEILVGGKSKLEEKITPDPFIIF
jgi:CRISPR-associated protein Cas2